MAHRYVLFPGDLDASGRKLGKCECGGWQDDPEPKGVCPNAPPGNNMAHRYVLFPGDLDASGRKLGKCECGGWQDDPEPKGVCPNAPPDTFDSDEPSSKKARTSDPPVEVGAATCRAMLAGGGPQIPDHGTTVSLQLPRTAMVENVIKLAEGETRQVYIRGAAGTGKSVLLALVGQELERQGKRVVFVLDARKLAGMWSGILQQAAQAPVYLLADEVHASASSEVWAYLKLPLHMRPDVYTIAAGIPDETKASSLFQEHTKAEDILLDLEELQDQKVVDFFAGRLQQALQQQQTVQDAPPANAMQNALPGPATQQQPEHSASPGLVTPQHRNTALQVLRFSHYYTQGHAYPCLKLTEHFLTMASAQCMSTDDVPSTLLAVIASELFRTSVFKRVFNRCYSKISSTMAAKLLSTLERPAEADKVYVELTRLGLWMPVQRMSLLLQYTVMDVFREATGTTTEEVEVSYDKFGNVLFFALRNLRDVHFSQISSVSDFARQRCEDGIGLFIGARLSTISGLYLSPQHALPVPGQRGRPPSVDYYLNGTLDMFLELTRNGSKLEEHFQRFQQGGKYHGKRFVLLDIELTKCQAPTPLPAHLQMYEQHRFTYVVPLNTLFCGTNIFKSGVQPLVAQNEG